ncbi:MAG: Bax inhibitor-1/YccA family protein [Bacilli bacterium]|nr:Bax inhibitor-1/YccA family protein [Bacilli bacterium]
MATYDFNTSSPGTPGNSGVGVKSTQTSLLGKTFTYMFLFLLLTVAVTVGVSAIFQFAIKDVNVRNDAYFITLITASITQIVLTVVIAFTSLKRGKAAVIPLVLYAVCMGVLLSSFTFLGLEWYTLAATFGIAALAFGGMALIGTRSKKATGMGLIGFGLLFGILIAGLFNIFLALFLPGGFAIVNIITSILIVVAIMLITAYDVHNIKQISMRCQADNNLALYLAFNLYLDFIIILIHLLRLVAIFSSNR